MLKDTRIFKTQLACLNNPNRNPTTKLTPTQKLYIHLGYYDPAIGRFINADDQITNGSILGTNLYAYCYNNPVNMVDHYGEVPFALALPFFGTVTVPPLLIAATFVVVALAFVYCVNPDFRKAVNQIVADVSRDIENSFAPPATPAYNQGSAIASPTASVSTPNQSSIANEIAKTMAKAGTKIQTERYRWEYWIAQYVDFGNGQGTFIPTMALTYSSAISYVRAGGSVFAASKTQALRLAIAVGNGGPATPPEIHGSPFSGYWWHYHDGRRIGGHIFYVT